MPSDSLAPVRTWLSRTPDVVLLAFLGAIVSFALRQEMRGNDMDRRLTTIETKVDAIADRVGASDREEHATR
jgi:hypothetical protein